MAKDKFLNIRFNPEKSADKKILDYFDKSLVPKTTLVKTALIHEIERLEATGDPYIKKEITKDSDKSPIKKQKPNGKERLKSGFTAFSSREDI